MLGSSIILISTVLSSEFFVTAGGAGGSGAGAGDFGAGGSGAGPVDGAGGTAPAGPVSAVAAAAAAIKWFEFPPLWLGFLALSLASFSLDIPAARRDSSRRSLPNSSDRFCMVSPIARTPSPVAELIFSPVDDNDSPADFITFAASFPHPSILF